MSTYSKERSGTYMGDPAKQERTKGVTKNRVGDSQFKSGKLLNGLNEHGDQSWPKRGRIAANFKDLRDSKISKGSI